MNHCIISKTVEIEEMRLGSERAYQRLKAKPASDYISIDNPRCSRSKVNQTSLRN